MLARRLACRVPLVAFVVLGSLTACGSAGQLDATTPASASAGDGTHPSLDGTWVTDTIPAEEIRSVVLDAGFTDADADSVIGDTSLFRFTLTFEEGRYSLMSSWDEEDVGELESGGFTLQPDSRLLLDTGESGDTYLFRVTFEEDGFTLDLLSTTESGSADDKYKHSYYTTAFYTRHRFARAT